MIMETSPHRHIERIPRQRRMKALPKHAKTQAKRKALLSQMKGH